MAQRKWYYHLICWRGRIQLTDPKMTLQKHMAQPHNVPAQSGSSALTPGCVSLSLRSSKSLFTYTKCHSKHKHQFLKYPMNALTLPRRIELSPPKGDLGSKTWMCMMWMWPDPCQVTEMIELHSITAQPRKLMFMLFNYWQPGILENFVELGMIGKAPWDTRMSGSTLGYCAGRVSQLS